MLPAVTVEVLEIYCTMFGVWEIARSIDPI